MPHSKKHDIHSKNHVKHSKKNEDDLIKSNKHSKNDEEHSQNHDKHNEVNKASYKFEKEGVTIEFNIYINLYNTNDNNNNLANQHGKAGVTVTASDNSQISGNHGKNEQQGLLTEQITELLDEKGQLIRREQDSDLHDGPFTVDFSIKERE